MSEVQISRSSESFITTVASSASNQTLVAANARRKKMIIHNNSTAILFVTLGTAASTLTTGNSFQIPTLQAVEIEGWCGAVTCIHASANGSVQCTELS